MFQQLPTDNGIRLSTRRFHLHLVLVTAMVSSLLCFCLALKLQLLLLGTGPEREASMRPHGNEANLLQRSYQYSGWGKKKLRGLFCIPKLEFSLLWLWHSFILTDTRLVLSWVQLKLGRWGEGEKDCGPKVWWELMQFCFHTLDLKWPFLLKKVYDSVIKVCSLGTIVAS